MATSGENSFEYTAPNDPVEPPSAAFATEARQRLDNLVMPAGTRRLVDAACWLAATQRQLPPRQLVDIRLVLSQERQGSLTIPNAHPFRPRCGQRLTVGWQSIRSRLHTAYASA